MFVPASENCNEISINIIIIITIIIITIIIVVIIIITIIIVVIIIVKQWFRVWGVEGSCWPPSSSK